MDINLTYDHGVYNYDILGRSYHENIDTFGFFKYKVFDFNNSLVEENFFDFSGEVRVYYEDGIDISYKQDYFSHVFSVSYNSDIGSIEVYDKELNNVLIILFTKPVTEEVIVSEKELIKESDYIPYIFVLVLIIILIIFIFFFGRLKKKIFLFFILFSFLVAGIDESLITTDLSSQFSENSLPVTYNGDLNLFQENGLNVITFDKPGAVLNVGDNKFENIVPYSDKVPSKITLDASGNIIDANFLVGRQGGSYLINGIDFYAPPGSTVIFKDGVINLDIPKGVELTSLPISSSETSIMKIKGEGVWLVDGVRLDSGEINFKGDGFYTRGAVINGIRVTSSEDTRLFFDGKKQDLVDNYVSFGEKNVYANIVKDKGNYNLDFTKTSFFAEDVAFSLNDNADYYLNIKDGKNRPVVSWDVAKLGDGQELFTLKNGGNVFSFRDDFALQALVSGGVGAPFSVTSPKIPDQFVRFNEDGSYDFLSYNKYPSVISVNNVNKDLIEKHYNIKLDGDYSKEDLLVIADILDKSTPEMLSSLKSVGVRDDIQSLLDACALPYIPEHINVRGCAGSGDVFLLRSSIPSEVLSHEMAHNLQDRYESADFQKSGESVSSLEKEWTSLAVGSNDESYDYLEAVKSKGTGKPLIDTSLVSWAEGSETPTQLLETKYSQENPRLKFDKNVDLGDPAYGFARPYGAVNWNEDISTMVESVKFPESSNLQPYICEKSPYYSKGQIYVKKIDLLYKNKFITQEDYNNLYASCSNFY